MPARKFVPLRFVAAALLLASFGCALPPAPAPPATAPAGATPTLFAVASAVLYPTLPAEWTATATPTVTHTPVPPTPTRTATPVPTLAVTVTAATSQVFTGTTGVTNLPFALLAGLYRVDWEYIGPDNTAFALRLAAPDSNTTLTFVDAQGPQRGASDLRIVGTADLLLAVVAMGDWVVFIQPYAASATPALSPTPGPSPTPTTTVGLPAPT